MTATPVRAAAARRRDGCLVLEESEVGHTDGGEPTVRRILERVADRSSLSDELSGHDETWETRYHFAKERPNVLRPLAWRPDAAVLEIGAGCGAVTRFLGETCGAVDALEPTAERAAIARLRTADLENVEVMVGSLDAIPAEPAYDAIVIVGVLEYVGGRDGHEARVDFLRGARERLRPGGWIACAIENRLGVQYLAGAPEEHVARAYEGLEDYPRSGPARTYARATLERLFAEAGLECDVHHVFPDYKFARLVFSDGLLETEAAPLAWRAPDFPSGASPHPRPRGAAEFHLWRSLVRSGLGAQFANSFLVLAAEDLGAAEPWPADLHGAFYSVGRRATFMTESRLHGPDLSVIRRRLHTEAPEEIDGVLHRCQSRRWHAGESLIERLEHADEAQTRTLLREWVGHVHATASEDGVVDIDLVPHNIILADGGMVSVDQEWFSRRYEPADVVDRGVLQLGLALADRVPPERWAGATTVRDVVLAVADWAGVEGLDSRLEREVVPREAALLTAIAGRTGDEARSAQAALFERGLARPLAETELGRREHELRAEADAAAGRFASEVEALRDALARHKEAAAQAEQAHASLLRQYEAVVRSRSWRLTAAARRLTRVLR